MLTSNCKPLRTYQRKAKKPLKNKSVFCGYPAIASAGRYNSTANHDCFDNGNDPFETTFDRIAKEVVVPPLPPDTNPNDFWSSGDSSGYVDDNTANLSKTPDRTVFDPFTPSYTDLTYKNAFTRKLKKSQECEPRVAIARGTVSKRAKVSKSTKETLGCKSTSMKPCSVVLSDKVKRCNELLKKKKVNNASVEKSAFEISHRHTDNGDIDRNLERISIKDCRVKMERLDVIDKFVEKKDAKEKQRMICSTPIGKRATIYSMLLSPIKINSNFNVAINVQRKQQVQISSQQQQQQRPSTDCTSVETETELPASLLHISAETDRSRSLFSDTTTTTMTMTMTDGCSNHSVNDAVDAEEKYFARDILERKTDNVNWKGEKYEYTTERKVIGGNVNGEIAMNDNKYNSLLDDDDVDTLLTRLQDSTRVTKRKKRYPAKWSLSASKTFENTNMSAMSKNGATDNNRSLSAINDFERSKHAANPFLDPFELLDDTNARVERRSLFLKPGKSWTRSLSILNNINAGCNLQELSIGKGKKWRCSVRDVLDMQKKRALDVSSSLDDDDDDDKCEALGRARYSKRISVRVVPNDTNVECEINDSPFLEAFGITADISSSGLKVSDEKRCIRDARYDNDDEIVGNHSSARDVVLQKCSQNCYLPFSECFPDSYLKYCRKIGEGVYGEVFLYECNDNKSVIKIIPIEGAELVNGERQKKFSEILSEIVIAKELHHLRWQATYGTSGFVQVKNVKCIIGKYPEKLLHLWNIYDDDKTSDNDCPSVFGENQLYIALELDHGGEDLEAFVFETAEEAYALFLQTAFTLAIAEKALQFEHRDLHWGNVLIAKTKESYIRYNLDGEEIKIPSNGVKVSIIDFTLSRMLYQGCCIYNDLALDPALFVAHGEYQFDVYRLMRDKIQNNWQKFEPYTNVLWLHYTLDKMITAVRYKKKKLKVHKHAIVKLKKLKDTILSYDSAFDFIISQL